MSLIIKKCNLLLQYNISRHLPSYNVFDILIENVRESLSAYNGLGIMSVAARFLGLVKITLLYEWNVFLFLKISTLNISTKDITTSKVNTVPTIVPITVVLIVLGDTFP